MKNSLAVFALILLVISLSSCSTTKEIYVKNEISNLEPKISATEDSPIGRKVNQAVFASLLETTSINTEVAPTGFPSTDWQTSPNQIIVSTTQIDKSLKQNFTNFSSNINTQEPPENTDPVRNPNFYARTSLTLGLVGFFTAISIWGPIICGTLAIIYSKKSKVEKEPNQKKARAGRFWGIASFIAIPLVYIGISILEFYL